MIRRPRATTETYRCQRFLPDAEGDRAIVMSSTYDTTIIPSSALMQTQAWKLRETKAISARPSESCSNQATGACL